MGCGGGSKAIHKSPNMGASCKFHTRSFHLDSSCRGRLSRTTRKVVETECHICLKDIL